MHLHVASWVLPIAARPIPDGGVLVAQGRIVAVGPADGLRERASQVTEYAGILLPGLVNAHAHLQYGPSFADLAGGGQAFPDWLLTMTQRRVAMSDEGWRQEVAGSWAMAYASGTIAVADIVTSVAALDVDVPGVRYLESVALASDAWPAEQRRLEPLLAAHHDTGLSPHTLYTIGTAVLRGSIDLARQAGRRLHPHLAETADEDQFVRHGTGPFAQWPFAAELRDGTGEGRSPAEYLDFLDGLGADVHVAHGTHLSQRDRTIVRSRGTAVALCARSNAILGSGVPPVAALLREGNAIAIGTDSLASTPDLDLLAEARALAAAATAQGYQDDDLARRILHACTAGGAYAIGRPDLGVLTPGATAALAHITVDDLTNPDIAREILRTGRAEPVRAQADSTT